MMNQTSLQIYETQERLRAAQDAQRQREEAARAPQQAIQQEQARLAQLQAQQRLEQFAAGAQRVEQNVSTVTAANNAVIAALNAGNILGALPLFQEAMRALEHHEQLRFQAMGCIDADIQAAAEAARQNAAASADGNFQANTAAQQVAWQYEQRLPLVAPVSFVVVEWLAQARGQAMVQLRQGLVYILLGGAIWTPREDYSALRAYQSQQQAQRRGFHG